MLGGVAAAPKGAQDKTPASRGSLLHAPYPLSIAFSPQKALTKELKDNVWFLRCIYCPYSRAVRLTINQL